MTLPPPHRAILNGGGQQATRHGFATITLTCDIYPYNSGG